jgi:arylsulfatase A-like enzyme
MLYNLAEDLSESKNVAAEHPEKVKEMKAQLERML